MEELTGRYRRTRWINEEETFLIGQLEDGSTIKGSVVGQPPSFGLTYTFMGNYVTHPQYGRQFEFKSYRVQVPKDKRSVIQYLTKYTENCGIGPVIADRICDEFRADDALRMLREHPTEVAKRVKGLQIENAHKASRQLKMLEKYEETVVELTALFAGRGFSQACIDRCIEKWGALAPSVVRRDPFKMMVMKFPSAGFARCDSLYIDLGLSPTRLKRQLMCVWYFIRSDSSGSTWFTQHQLAHYLRENVSADDVSLKKVLQLGVRSRWLATEQVAGDEVWVSTQVDATDENLIADKLARMMRKPKKVKGVAVKKNVDDQLIDTSKPRRVLG